MFVRARFRAGAGKLTFRGNDMKTQMRFQKILVLLALIVSAITIVYAFGFFTGDLATLHNMINLSATNFFRRQPTDVQNALYSVWSNASIINTLLMWLGIAFLLIVAFLYITASQSRRNYYTSNYVAVILAAVYAIVFAIVGIATITYLVISLNTSVTPDIWQAYQAYCSNTGGLAETYYSHSPAMLYIGYVLYVIVLGIGVALIYNLIWKIKLMKGEKALLEGGLQKEVA